MDAAIQDDGPVLKLLEVYACLLESRLDRASTIVFRCKDPELEVIIPLPPPPEHRCDVHITT
jgi:hypothetical protein